MFLCYMQCCQPYYLDQSIVSAYQVIDHHGTPTQNAGQTFTALESMLTVNAQYFSSPDSSSISWAPTTS